MKRKFTKYPITSNTKITAATDVDDIARDLCEVLRNNNDYFFDYEVDGTKCTIIVSEEDEDGYETEVKRIKLGLASCSKLSGERLDDEIDNLSMKVEAQLP